MSTTIRPRLAALALALTTTVVLAGCGNDTTGSASTPTGTTSTSSATGAGTLKLAEGWCKAFDPATSKMGMTACFGTFENSDSKPVTISSAKTTVARSELHETVNGVMRPKEGGFVIPASGTFPLEPGANHLMLLDVKQKLEVGDEVKIELTTSNGKVDLALPVRAFAGGNENYDPNPSGTMSMDPSGGMSMAPSGTMSMDPSASR